MLYGMEEFGKKRRHHKAVQMMGRGRATSHTREAGHIPFSVLRRMTENFKNENMLGRGGFGQVYRGKMPDGSNVAVKRMEVVATQGVTEYEMEISVLTKVRQRNLVDLIGFCTKGRERLLVYEYMPNGTLTQHLFDPARHSHTLLTWPQRLNIALDVARGVAYLHSGYAGMTFIHRDLKPSNILLTDDLRAKVSDFGLMRRANDENQSVLMTGMAGTFGYLAPEYHVSFRVSAKVDVFPFGVILLQLVTGRRVVDGSSDENLATWFQRAVINQDIIHQEMDQSLVDDDFESLCKVVDVARLCIASVDARPSMLQVFAQLVEIVNPRAILEEPTVVIEVEGLPEAVQKLDS